MDALVKRIALASLLLTAAVVASPLTAGAIGSSGLSMSSPAEAAGGTPMWIRSVSPCPAASSSDVHRFVEAWIAPQAGALRDAVSEVTGDVGDDGHWEVTLIAPKGPGAGTTAHYYVRASCLEDDPWAAAPLDEDTQVKPIAVAYYEVNPLWVTSADGGGEGMPSEFLPDPDQFEVVTTTTAPRETTTTTDASTATTAAAPTTIAPASLGGGASVEQAKARIAAARAELAARGVDTDSLSDREVLLVSPVSAGTALPERAHGGIPWWAFALATMLAVGAVVAYGAARRASAA